MAAGIPAETYPTSRPPMLCAQAASERSAASSVWPLSGDAARPSSVSLISARASRAAVPACRSWPATAPATAIAVSSRSAASR